MKEVLRLQDLTMSSEIIFLETGGSLEIAVTTAIAIKDRIDFTENITN